MNQYLLDTNICIYFLGGKFNLIDLLETIGISNCFISEITLAELKYGVENSIHKEKNQEILDQFSTKFTIIPIFNCLDVYAKEKARLKKQGRLLDDFDLLIGATAIKNGLILATRNVSDFNRLDGIEIIDWTK